MPVIPPPTLPADGDALCALVDAYVHSKQGLTNPEMRYGYLVAVCASMVAKASAAKLRAELLAYQAYQARRVAHPPIPRAAAQPAADAFHYNPESTRYAIGERDLHCGDCFELRRGDAWVPVSIELSQEDWYLTGIAPAQADRWEGVEARFA